MPTSLTRGKYVICGVDDRGVPAIVEGGGVLQRDGTIVAVGKWEALTRENPGAEAVGGPEDVVFPGFVNAHHHVGLTPLQLGSPDLPLELWINHRLGGRAVDWHLDALYSAFEMVESGITTVQHLHGRIPPPVDAIVAGAEETIRAYREIGMRVSYSYGIRDQNRLVYEDDNAFIARLPADLAGEVRAFLGRTAVDLDGGMEVFEALHRRHAGSERVAIQLAPVNLHWCSDPALERIADTARRHRVPMHMHLVETAFQKEYGRRRGGSTALGHIDRLGLLGPDLTLGHGVWLTEDDIDRIAETGTCICHNCSSNLRLRSGVAPLNAFRKRGVTVALGLDEAGINDDRDMLQEMRLVLRQHRVPGLDAADVPSVGEVFRMATEGGAMTTPFGARIGRLEAGRAADLVALPWKSVAYPFLDPATPVLDALVQRAKAPVDTVMVAGEVILRGGRFTRIDKDAALAELAARMAAPPGELERRNRAMAHGLLPHVRAFYEAYALDERARDPFYRPSSRV